MSINVFRPECGRAIRLTVGYCNAKFRLQLFDRRAFTNEAKLQIRLAKLEYTLSWGMEFIKLRGIMGEQLGWMGTGNYPYQEYYRAARNRISRIESELEDIYNKKMVKRDRRHEIGFPIVALAGYTQAGHRSTTAKAIHCLFKLFLWPKSYLRTELTAHGNLADVSETKLVAVRAVIFDLDGTLVDSNWLHLRSWRIALERLGISAPDREIVDRFGLKTVDIARAVASSHDEQTVTKLVHLKSQLFEEAWPRELKTQEGALEILGMIRTKGLLSGVASSNTTERTLRIVQHFRMDSLLDVVVGIEEVEAGKPDPALVRTAINKLAATPKESIYVGDSKYDILAGRAAGARTVLIVQPIAAQSNLQVEPDYRVNHLDELRRIIWPRDCEMK